MKTKVDSRGPSINTELCVANSGNNRFDMVIMAAARAREIKRQHKDSDRRDHVFPIVTALLEIQEGKLNTTEYVKRIR
jgi:DNA-directed RNA polymerase omega subunit